MCFEGIIPVVVSALAYFIRYIYYGIMILGLWCLTPLFNNISVISYFMKAPIFVQAYLTFQSFDFERTL